MPDVTEEFGGGLVGVHDRAAQGKARADEAIKEFGLKSGEKAVRLDRLYLSAGRPVMLGACWLAPEAASLSRADIEDMSTAAVHSVLLRHPIASSTHTIGAELAGASAAQRATPGRRHRVGSRR